MDSGGTKQDSLNLVEWLIAAAFGLGAIGGAVFAARQTPAELPNFAGGKLGPGAAALLAASPTLLGAFAVLTALWIALRAAAAAQLRQADLQGAVESTNSERVAASQAWSDVESLVAFGGFGFTFGAVSWTLSLGGGAGALSLAVALGAVGALLGLYAWLKRWRMKAHSRERGTRTTLGSSLDVEGAAGPQ